MTKNINTNDSDSNQPKPPFNLQSAREKVQKAQDLWNSKDPAKVALAYTQNSKWRNRDQFIQGRKEIVEFLTKKWAKELGYSLKKELFAFEGNKIAVDFEYEYHDSDNNWYRAYGIEHWIFDEDGLMRDRKTSINETAINQNDRKFFNNLNK
jgi:nuclear transport factor 2 (NTF2) superfamily protein